MAGEMPSCATPRPGTTPHNAATTASVDAERREACMMPPARRGMGNRQGLLSSRFERGQCPHNERRPEILPGRRRSYGHAIGVPLLIRLHFLRERTGRSEEHTSELQSRLHLVCRLLLEKKKKNKKHNASTMNQDTSLV